jgi:hypothetical protein
MFLNESEKDPSGPFLRMEIVELFSFPELYIFGMSIVLGVGGADDGVEEGHPATDDIFDFRVDLIVNCLPYELNAQIDDFGLLPPGDEFK